MDAHKSAVATIAEQVKQFHTLQKPFRIYHGSTNSTRRSSRRADNTIDTSHLTHILSVNTESRTALVEPNVPMDALLAAALKHDLLPHVVMEFPGITVGGAFSGTSGESSSFRYGAFDATVKSVEIVLPTGMVEMASKTANKPLFWGAASAFGTLGVVTMLEVELREAKRFVQMTYTVVGSAAAGLQVMEEAKAVDYLDGITFTRGETVVCEGRLADLPKGEKEVRVLGKGDPWYYIHVKGVLERLKKQKGGTIVDYMPIEDYLFRYDRGGFWVGRYGFQYFITPFNRLTRYLLDKFMHARVMYRAVHKSGLADTYMIQDVGVPYDKVDEFQSWLDKEFNIYPLWLCPLRVQRDDPDSCYGLHSQFGKPGAPNLMNFGIWGPMKANRREAVERNRALERKVAELGGKKWLYAHAYYTEEEFWAHYDKQSYDELREKYGAGYLPSVYDKVKVDVDEEERRVSATWKSKARHAVGGVWPVRGAYGFYKAVRGGDYLMQKKK